MNSSMRVLTVISEIVHNKEVISDIEWGMIYEIIEAIIADKSIILQLNTCLIIKDIFANIKNRCILRNNEGNLNPIPKASSELKRLIEVANFMELYLGLISKKP